MDADVLKALKSGLFLMKKPREFVLSACSNSENAIGGAGISGDACRVALPAARQNIFIPSYRCANQEQQPTPTAAS
jgi:hypothetical protein